MYDEFQRYWVVNDPDDLQDRFEEFLKSKQIDPDQIEDYDDFIEAWTEYYDEDLDFDDLETYAWGLYPVEDPDDYDFDPDEYDILLDDDLDYLYDDYSVITASACETVSSGLPCRMLSASSGVSSTAFSSS